MCDLRRQRFVVPCSRTREASWGGPPVEGPPLYLINRLAISRASRSTVRRTRGSRDAAIRGPMTEFLCGERTRREAQGSGAACDSRGTEFGTRRRGEDFARRNCGEWAQERIRTVDMVGVTLRAPVVIDSCVFTRAQKKIMIMICVAILVVVLASTVAGYFGL